MPTPKRGTNADPKTGDANGSTIAEHPEDVEKKSRYADAISFVDDQTVIEFRKTKFAFPTSRAMWPTKAFQAFQRQRHADGVELVLGPKQWELFNQIAPAIADFWEFLPLFAEAAGFVSLDAQ